VLPIDANLEGFWPCCNASIGTASATASSGVFPGCKRRRALDHQSQLEFLTLLRVRGEAGAVPLGLARHWMFCAPVSASTIPGSMPTRLPRSARGLRVIAAAHAPMQLDFTAYRTPLP